MELIVTPSAADLDPRRGMDAYRNNSFSPEKRVEGDIAGYVSDVLDFAAAVEAVADTPERIEEARQQVEAFRQKYIQWEYTLWAAKSRTASPMITGPARFPVDRNRKAMDAEMKKIDKFLYWIKNAKPKAIKAVQMVGYVAPPKPDGAPSGQVETQCEGFKIVENFDMDRIQIVFPDKPSEGERAILKGEAFKWAPSQGAWQRQLTNNARWAAKRVTQKLAAV